MVEEKLRQREKELAEREIDLLQRELNMMIQQRAAVEANAAAAAVAANTPTPKKRRGNFKKSRLKLLKKDNTMISAPSGMCVLHEYGLYYGTIDETEAGLFHASLI